MAANVWLSCGNFLNIAGRNFQLVNDGKLVIGSETCTILSIREGGLLCVHFIAITGSDLVVDLIQGSDVGSNRPGEGGNNAPLYPVPAFQCTDNPAIADAVGQAD